MGSVMNHVHQQTQIGAPVEPVFELLCQMDRQREWNPYMEHWHITGPIDQVGTTFDTMLDLIGQSTPYKSAVVEVVPRRLVHVRRDTAKGDSDWFYRLEPAGTGTLFSIDVDYGMEGTLAGVVDRYLYHNALDRAVRHMTQSFATVAASTLVPA